jgi:hypothetical protein
LRTAISIRSRGAFLHPAPPKRGGGTARSAVGGARASTKLLRRKQSFMRDAPLHHASHGPPPPLAGGRINEIVLAARFCARALSNRERTSLKKKEGGAPRGASIQWPHHISKRCRLNMRGARLRASQTSLRSLRTLSATAPARLPALHRGTRRTRRIQYRLSSRPALPETRLGGRYPLSPVTVYRAPRGPVVVPVGRGPKAARERFARPHAGFRARSALQIASGKRPSASERRRLLLIAKVESRIVAECATRH